MHFVIAVVCQSTTKLEAVLIKRIITVLLYHDRKTEATDYSCAHNKWTFTTLSDLFKKIRTANGVKKMH
jgi:hypothetical protein